MPSKWERQDKNFWRNKQEELKRRDTSRYPTDHPMHYLPHQEQPALPGAPEDGQDDVQRRAAAFQGKRYAERVAEAREEQKRVRGGIQPQVERSNVSQARVDWKEEVERMPLGETMIDNQKHSLLMHMKRLRENPVYRWKRERFVCKQPAVVTDMARRRVIPEVMVLQAGAPVPRGIDAERANIVYCDLHALAVTAGVHPSRCPAALAEYFIPEEEPKNELWLEESDLSLSRVAVLLGVTEPAALGLQLRAAVGMGYDCILLSDCADPYSDEALETSVCAHVTAGGYPRVHVVREEDGDDIWGIVNRVIAKHDLLPVAVAPSRRQDSQRPSEVWDSLRSSDQLHRGMCVFFGGERGLDVDLVVWNTERDVSVMHTLDAQSIGSGPHAAVAMSSLKEPRLPLPEGRLAALDGAAAAAPDGEAVPVPVLPRADPAAPHRRMQLSKWYADGGGPAFRTEVSWSGPAAPDAVN
eukprot:TRINITY_DN46914_c0_g1_i1.p1 TRINITY_DN46914_c0_g1~~TRINITY_DN46914_c0_g1_i1.p1  ORF type:complete len:507 (+),score=159.93 TRINITY_DN46914_c0_g1_i1:117-1523(+)